MRRGRNDLAAGKKTELTYLLHKKLKPRTTSPNNKGAGTDRWETPGNHPGGNTSQSRSQHPTKSPTTNPHKKKTKQINLKAKQKPRSDPKENLPNLNEGEKEYGKDYDTEKISVNAERTTTTKKPEEERADGVKKGVQHSGESCAKGVKRAELHRAKIRQYERRIILNRGKNGPSSSR